MILSTFINEIGPLGIVGCSARQYPCLLSRAAATIRLLSPEPRAQLSKPINRLRVMPTFSEKFSCAEVVYLLGGYMHVDMGFYLGAPLLHPVLFLA